MKLSHEEAREIIYNDNEVRQVEKLVKVWEAV